MVTATMSRTDALEKATELLGELKELQAQYDEKKAEVRELLEFGDSSEDERPARAAPATKPATTGHRGRPAGSTNKPKASKANANGKVAPDERNYTNEKGLKQTIWDILDSGPKHWAKLLKDLPKDAEGLTVSEIKEIIELEGKWKSSSDNISTQLSSHLTNLRGDKLIARADGGRYYIVDGAELVTGKRGRKAAA